MLGSLVVKTARPTRSSPWQRLSEALSLYIIGMLRQLWGGRVDRLGYTPAH